MTRREAIWITLLVLFAAALLAASWWANELADRDDLLNSVRNDSYESAIDKLARVFSVNFRSEEGCTPLYYAAARGDVQLIRRLLARGADATIDCYNRDEPDHYMRGRTPLHEAIISAPETVPAMLDHGAAADAADAHGNTPLGEAMRRGWRMRPALPSAVIPILLDHGADANAADDEGYTPLQYAVQRGDVQLVRLLLSRGAEFPTVPAKPWQEPITLAANSGSLEMVRFILDLGYAVEDAYAAALFGDITITRYLLERGMDANTATVDGYTALYFANDPDRMDVLLTHGADLNIQSNTHARTPLHHITGTGSTELIQRLVDHGADVNARDFQGQTPLYRALNEPDTMRFLIELGADINTTDNAGDTVLHAAARRNSDALAYLLKLGADVNRRDTLGNTPLHDAAEVVYLESVQLLLEYGADPEFQNYAGATPAEMLPYQFVSRADGIAILDLLSENPVFTSNMASGLGANTP